MSHLPIQLAAPLTFEEQVALLAMEHFHPHTSFSPGDHAMLSRDPLTIRSLQRLIGQEVPSTWEIRFVISAWTYELYAHIVAEASGATGHIGLLHTIRTSGIDEDTGNVDELVIDRIEEEFALNSSLMSYDYCKPVIYAHGWPHGAYPNTAAWFFNPKLLSKLNLVNPTEHWEPLLDAFKTPFAGYESEHGLGFVFDIAPDHYAGGVNLKGPLTHEEDAFHTASLLGLEEYVMTPLTLAKEPLRVDRQHPLITQ